MRAVRKGANISYDTVFTAALVGIPSGLVISRLLHVVDNIVVAKLHPELIGYVIDYTQYPELIIGAAGLTIWGGVLGTALGIWIYSKLSNFQFGYFADLVAPGIMLAQAIGRIGCTINGCCHGIATSLPWGIVYPSSAYFCDPALIGQAVHPTQVYEIIYNLIVFGVLLKLRGRLKPVGSLFILYLSLYSLWRFGIDFLRTGMPFLFGLHQAQVTALIVLAITIPILALRTRWVKADDNTG
jgi:phosphatidylglycerol:prolipoprotein diacylglycerol transferase